MNTVPLFCLTANLSALVNGRLDEHDVLLLADVIGIHCDDTQDLDQEFLHSRTASFEQSLAVFSKEIGWSLEIRAAHDHILNDMKHALSTGGGQYYVG